MKIILVVISATCMLLPYNKINAQVLNPKKKNGSAIQLLNSPTGNTSAVNNDSVWYLANSLEINYPLVYKNLISQYKHIKKLRYSAEGDILFISFINKGKETSAVYYPNGKMEYSITNFGGDLPLLKIKRLQVEYPFHSIFYCKEIKTNNKTIYQVVLDNRDEYRVININDEEMEEIQQMKKTAIQ